MDYEAMPQLRFNPVAATGSVINAVPILGGFAALAGGDAGGPPCGP